MKRDTVTVVGDPECRLCNGEGYAPVGAILGAENHATGTVVCDCILRKIEKMPWFDSDKILIIVSARGDSWGSK